MAKLRTRIASEQQQGQRNAACQRDAYSFFAQYCFDLGIELFVLVSLPLAYYILISPFA